MIEGDEYLVRAFAEFGDSSTYIGSTQVLLQGHRVSQNMLDIWLFLVHVSRKIRWKTFLTTTESARDYVN